MILLAHLRMTALFLLHLMRKHHRLQRMSTQLTMTCLVLLQMKLNLNYLLLTLL